MRIFNCKALKHFYMLYHCLWHIRKTQFLTSYYTHYIEIPAKKGSKLLQTLNFKNSEYDIHIVVNLSLVSFTFILVFHKVLLTINQDIFYSLLTTDISAWILKIPVESIWHNYSYIKPLSWFHNNMSFSHSIMQSLVMCQLV